MTVRIKMALARSRARVGDTGGFAFFAVEPENRGLVVARAASPWVWEWRGLPAYVNLNRTLLCLAKSRAASPCHSIRNRGFQAEK